MRALFPATGARPAAALLLGLGLAAAPSGAIAQDRPQEAFPEERPPALAPEETAPAAPRPEPAVPTPTMVLPAEGEDILLPRLKALVVQTEIRQSAAADAAPGLHAEGLNDAFPPELAARLRNAMAPMVGQPVSEGSLQRLQLAVRSLLREAGRTFAQVYLPGQDITEGVLTIVIAPARLDQVTVEGNDWFAADAYTAGLSLEPGQPIDGAALSAGLDRVSRNPFREARVVAEPGERPGTTRLVLRARDRVPLRVFGGYANNGSESTDYDRVFLGFDWGMIPVIDGLLTYQLRADPAFEKSESHSLTYVGYLPEDQTLSVFGAYSTSEPDSGSSLIDSSSQSWQLGGSWSIPLASDDPDVTRSLTLGADFKASRNDQRFLGTSFNDVITHIFQGSVAYTHSIADRLGVTSASARVVASPGGITDRNETSVFRQVRAGASADYVYGALDLTRQTTLPWGLSWQAEASAQLSADPLLGSEQIGAGGPGAVRGYRDDELYTDNGAQLRNTLYLPSFSLLDGRDQVSPFVFVDAGRHWNTDRTANEKYSTLASAGVGTAYSFGTYLLASAIVGVPLRASARTERLEPRAHLRLTVSF